MKYTKEEIKLILDTTASSNLDLSTLNDYSLGIVKGYLAAKAKKSLDDVLGISSDFVFCEGIKKGYRLFTSHKISSALDSYRQDKSIVNFNYLLDSVSIQPFSDYKIYKNLVFDLKGHLISDSIDKNYNIMVDLKKVIDVSIMKEDSKKASSLKVTDSKKASSLKVTDSFISLRKRIKDALSETEDTDAAINTVVDILNEPENDPCEVVAAAVDILAETIDILQDKVKEVSEEPTE